MPLGTEVGLDQGHIVLDGHSFAKRIINTWNSLPGSIVLSKSVATFRHKVNKLHFLVIVITEFSIVVHCFLLSCML